MTLTQSASAARAAGPISYDVKIEKRQGSSSELARLAGVTPTAVWNWENKNRMPQSKTLATLVSVLQVSKEWLLTGIEPKEGSSAIPAKPTDLSEFSLEELMAAIDRKGFTVSVTPKAE